MDELASQVRQYFDERQSPSSWQFTCGTPERPRTARVSIFRTEDSELYKDDIHRGKAHVDVSFEDDKHSLTLDAGKPRASVEAFLTALLSWIGAFGPVALTDLRRVPFE